MPLPPVENIERTTLLDLGRIAIERRVDRHADGSEHTRHVVAHPGAAVVLPLFADGTCLLVEQYRSALGEPLLEFPAGTIDRPESPEVTAARELEEETGFRAGRLTPLLSFRPAPGLTDEVMHVFVAEDLEPGVARPDPGEEFVLHRLPFAEIVERCVDGRIQCGKTLVTALVHHARSSAVRRVQR